MANPALPNATGAELNGVANSALTPASHGHGPDPVIGGPVMADPEHYVGNQSLYGLSGDNYANNTASVTAGNGVGNFIGGNVTADAHQDVGNFYGFGDNFANNSASAIVGNGAYNVVGGSVIVDADQQVGNHII